MTEIAEIAGSVDRLDRLWAPGIDVIILSEALNSKRALISAFDWSKTKQGWSYWCRIYETGHTDESRAIIEYWLKSLKTNSETE
jgi:hypothetical protein